ncbi:MAG TPA: dipeptide ABC transporter ATP-binding protein [Egibacteraceae bacterium]|nr:dipeptide ABC transporter ATP-binding protein [Egibacteraceae bacterium]
MRRPGRVLGILGGVFLAALFLMATVGPALTREDPTAPAGLPLQRPSGAHLLGTDDAGRDLFAQFVEGAQVSLLIGVLSAVVAVVVGLAVALIAGYHRGAIDSALMRLVDVTLALPFLPLVLVLAAFFGRGLWTTVLVIGLGLWVRPARVLRSQVLKVREFDHVVAAQAMGARTSRVLLRHVLPRVTPLAGAQFIRAANIGVMIEAALAFLGLGDPARMSWGTMLYFANARNAILTDAWMWWILPPGFGLTLLVLGFAFVGYAIEERTDPRLRKQVSRAPTPAPPARRRAKGTETASPELLRVENLTVAYDTPAGAVTAVKGVTFSMRKGRITGLVGESGCGKTTLLLALLGLLPSAGRITGGQVLFKGRDLLGPGGCLRAVRGRDVALVPQSAMNTLNPAYTVHRQVAEAAALTRSREAARQRATELLELVGLPAHRHSAYPHEFSGGMRQRAVIAMALANDPALLLADEPTTGLDVVTQGALLRLLLDLQARLGLTVLLVSHDLALVGRVADDILVMDDGEIVETGHAAQVTGSPTHTCTCRLIESIPTIDSPGATRPPPRADASPVLELRSVTKCFAPRGLLGRGRQPVVALDDVSLTVAEGQVLALVGESGSGKSTLARTVVGLARPDRGEVIVEGTDIASLSRARLREARRCMHLVLQDPYQSLHPGMRVAGTVAEPLVIAGCDADEIDARVAEALREVGLRPELRSRYPHELSGGQRQRVAFARALVGRPRLVVADEPTSMLDVSLQASVLRMVADLRDRHGIAFLFITHDLAVARSVADRIAVLYQGRLVECRPAEALIGAPEHDYTNVLVQAAKDPTSVAAR